MCAHDRLLARISRMLCYPWTPRSSAAPRLHSGRDMLAHLRFAVIAAVALATTAAPTAALASEASSQRGNSFEVPAPDTRPKPGSSARADRIRLAVQKTGTLAWELDVIKTHGLDRKHDLAIEVIELASTEAGKIAFKGGSADVMLSDWLWVARERSLGDNVVFHPSSSTLGAVMV